MTCDIRTDGTMQPVDLPAPSAVVARRVREHRALHGYTQATLVERLEKNFGWRVDRSVIARVESGERVVSVDELFMLAAVLDTSPSLLLTPADESELMSPTPWRPMTSNRVRGWIADEVRLWEQDSAACVLSSEVAWQQSAKHQEELDRLAALLMALHGVEDITLIDPSAPLSESAQADADILGLRLVLADYRRGWESNVGPWLVTELDGQIESLAKSSLAAAAASVRLWGHRATDEIERRTAPIAERPVESASDVRERAESMIEVLRAIVQDLLDVVPRETPPRSTTRTNRVGRRKGEGPA